MDAERRRQDSTIKESCKEDQQESEDTISHYDGLHFHDHSFLFNP